MLHINYTQRLAHTGMVGQSLRSDLRIEQDSGRRERMNWYICVGLRLIGGKQVGLIFMS